MNNTAAQPIIRAMGLHSFHYCERLFFLEEAEGLLLADDRVYAGRALHEELQTLGENYEQSETFEYTSEELGLTGKMDRLLKRNGQWIPYEHKRGRARTVGTRKEAWESDLMQVTAYALLLAEATRRNVDEARIRYHADNSLVKVPIDDALKQKTIDAIQRARELLCQSERPRITENDKLCLRCSLAPVCLPEENRISTDEEYEAIRLFPPAREKQTIHVTGWKAHIRKSGDCLRVENTAEGKETVATQIPLNEVESVTIHGSAQMSTQLLHHLAGAGIPIHWFTGGGRAVGSLNTSGSAVQRKIRQFEALRDNAFRLTLAKKLISAKCETQLRYILRTTRARKARSPEIEEKIEQMRRLLTQIPTVDNIDSLRGFEGNTARSFHSIIPRLFVKAMDPELYPDGRNRRPPTDPYNALLSFLYGLIFRSVHQAIIAVGLDPAFGFYHTPRSSAPPLVLDLMELFRVPLGDMIALGSMNRLSWDLKEDFERTKVKVWLSDSGRKKAIQLYETRLEDTWKHPAVNYSLSYYRMIELEVRLLEKEWTDKISLFAKARLR